MFEDDFSVLREAGLRSERMRKSSEEEDGTWWINALRDEADKVRSKSRKAGPRREPYEDVTANAPRATFNKERLDSLRQAAEAVKSRPKCKECGSRDNLQRGAHGLCQKCYDAKHRQHRGSAKAYWKVYFRGYEHVMSMVKEMAKQERRNVSDMVMIMLASEASRRLKRQAAKDANRHMVKSQ